MDTLHQLIPMAEELITQDPGKLLEYGHITDGKVYLKAYLHYPERQIGQVKTTDESALLYFGNRFNHITAKVNQLLSDIHEAANKGSYLMKLIHMREQLGTYDALGDFIPLFQKLDEAEDEIRGLIDVNRHKNLEIKSALLQELEAAFQVQPVEWAVLNATVKDIKDKWLKTGAVLKGSDEPLEGRFNEILNDYYDKRRAYMELRQRLIEERVAKYTDILNRTKALTGYDINPSWAIKSLKQMKDEWKEVGPIPKAYFEPIIIELKDVQKIVQRNIKNKRGGAKPGFNPKNQVFFDNMRKKQELIKKVYALSSIDLREAFTQAKQMQEEWKTLGNVPDHMKDEINREFNYACDRIFEQSYLMRNVYTRYRFFNSKSRIEQLSIKIQILKEILRRDEDELSIMLKTYESLTPDERRDPNFKPSYNRMRTQERKLKVKDILLKEMQTELAAL